MNLMSIVSIQKWFLFRNQGIKCKVTIRFK